MDLELDPSWTIKQFWKFLHPHTKREKENVQIEMCHKLILQNIIET